MAGGLLDTGELGALFCMQLAPENSWASTAAASSARLLQDDLDCICPSKVTVTASVRVLKCLVLSAAVCIDVFVIQPITAAAAPHRAQKPRVLSSRLAALLQSNRVFECSSDQQLLVTSPWPSPRIA